MVDFNQSHSEPVGDIERFVQEKPGNYRSEKPVNSTGINKYHLKCDCINGSFVNGIRERVWYNFALGNLQAFKYTENYEPHFLSKVLKLFFFSPITFYSSHIERRIDVWQLSVVHLAPNYNTHCLLIFLLKISRY